MEPILKLRDISKSYPEHRALDGVALSIPRGAFFSLLGPSGCGKTTTLRLIAGFEQPDSGEIILNGRDIRHARPHERNVSTVFQNYALFPHLNVFENVAFGLRRRHASKIDERVAAALQLVQLVGKENRFPAQISGGERQRAALARSLVLEPDVLLLDEPLSALDPRLRKQVRSELKALQRRVGTTFLFVTHDQEEAMSLSDSMAVMQHGRIEQVGTPEEIYLHPATRFVASFVGSVNWIGEVGVRPEALRIARKEPPENGKRSLPANVTGTSFLGNCVQVELRLATGHTAVAETSRLQEAFAPGDTVHAWWHAADELVFPG